MKSYDKVFCMIFFLFCWSSLSASSLRFKDTLEGFEGKVFTISKDSLTMEGVLFETNRNKAKPLIVFIQGSGPKPLFAQKDTAFYPLIPHQVMAYRNDYNFVFLSKPGIPAICKLSRLDEKYEYKDTVSYQPPVSYMKNNNLYAYTSLYGNLLNWLSKHREYSSIIVIGHSQGSRIAAELSSHTVVDKIVFMSADPLGRMATRYDREFSNLKNRNSDKLKFYDSIIHTPSIDSIYFGDTYYSWKSFSKPVLPSLVQRNCPVLIVYGALDENCPNCYVYSFLPEYYPHITVLNYENYNHNFFNEKGENNWEKVMHDVFSWIQNKN